MADAASSRFTTKKYQWIGRALRLHHSPTHLHLHVNLDGATSANNDYVTTLVPRSLSKSRVVYHRLRSHLESRCCHVPTSLPATLPPSYTDCAIDRQGSKMIVAGDTALLEYKREGDAKAEGETVETASSHSSFQLHAPFTWFWARPYTFSLMLYHLRNAAHVKLPS
ncbi:hypothetical protein JHK85_034940 [Glycine max]|nr:hypothetical protein JHK85_034940 [Glycine max]KAG4986606.1 hypothetical protein JHK86_034297 [Glycine max]